MVNSIQRLASTTQPTRPDYVLNADQKTKAAEILSRYDATSLTQTDSKEIISAFRENGIRPGKDLADIAQTSGFDLNTIEKQGGPPQRPERPDGPPPPRDTNSTTSVNAATLQTLAEILEAYNLEDLSKDDEAGIILALDEADLLRPGGVVDISA